MPANGSSTTTSTNTTNTTQRKTAATSRTDAAKIREGLTKVRNGSVSYARQTAERSVDVPVGAALTVADRVSEFVEPFTQRTKAEDGLKRAQSAVQERVSTLV